MSGCVSASQARVSASSQFECLECRRLEHNHSFFNVFVPSRCCSTEPLPLCTNGHDEKASIFPRAHRAYTRSPSSNLSKYLGRGHQFEIANAQRAPTAKRVAVQVVQDGGARRERGSPCSSGVLGAANQVAPLVDAVDGRGQVHGHLGGGGAT